MHACLHPLHGQWGVERILARRTRSLCAPLALSHPCTTHLTSCSLPYTADSPYDRAPRSPCSETICSVSPVASLLSSIRCTVLQCMYVSVFSVHVYEPLQYIHGLHSVHCRFMIYVSSKHLASCNDPLSLSRSLASCSCSHNHGSPQHRGLNPTQQHSTPQFRRNFSSFHGALIELPGSSEPRSTAECPPCACLHAHCLHQAS